MSRNTGFLVAVCGALLVSNAMAVELIFDPETGDSFTTGILPSGYGDRVTSTVQDGFKYSLSGGATPNVITRFGTDDAMVILYAYPSQYGDLVNTVYAQEPHPFEFRLVADPGFAVTLNSFDMAGWPELDFPSIASVSVEDGSGNVLFSQSNVYIQGDSFGPRHNHFSFSEVSAQELRIKFDSTTDGHGTILDSDDVGLDNINFSQTQTSAGLLGDYNNNGVVDAADYVLWRNGGPLQNEVATTGSVDAADYDAWRQRFGNHNPGSGSSLGSATVPELGTLSLILVGTAGLLPCRRRPTSHNRV